MKLIIQSIFKYSLFFISLIYFLSLIIRIGICVFSSYSIFLLFPKAYDYIYDYIMLLFSTFYILWIKVCEFLEDVKCGRYKMWNRK